MDSQDRKLCLDRQEVEDLGDGLLIGAVGKHNAVEPSAGQKLTHLGAQKTLSAEQRVCACVLTSDHVTHLCDDGLWVSLVHSQRYYRDINRIARAPGRTEQLIRNVPRLAHDHRHAESWGLLGSHRHHHLGE